MRVLFSRLLFLWMVSVGIVCAALLWGNNVSGYTVIYGDVRNNNELTLYETNRPHSVTLTNITALRPSVNDRFFSYTHATTGRVHILGTTDQRFVAAYRTELESATNIYSISPDGQFVLYSNWQGELRSYNVVTDETLTVNSPYYANVYRDTILWLPDNIRFLMQAVETGSNVSYYVLDASTVSSPPLYRNVAMIQPSRSILVLPFPNSDRLLNFNSQYVFITPDSDPHAPRTVLLEPTDYGNIRDLAVSPTGAYVAALLTLARDSEHYVLQLYDVENATWEIILEVGTPIEGLFPPFFVRWSPDGQQLMTTLTATDGSQCPYRTVTLNVDGSDIRDVFDDCNVRRMPYYLPR